MASAVSCHCGRDLPLLADVEAIRGGACLGIGPGNCFLSGA